MNLELTEEQELLQKTVREFAESEVKPLAKELDETGRFPRETFKKAAELGLTGIEIPEEEGGAGFDHIAYSIAIEEISRCCASTGVILSVQNSLYCDPIHRFGTEEQKKKFVAPFARGEKIGCYALTEPQGEVRDQRNESVDHQWRRRRCYDRLREHRSAERGKRNYRPCGREGHARLQSRQGRKKARHQRYCLLRTNLY